MSEKAERLYEQARGLEPGTQASFVEEACRGDPQLREELASLLQQAEAADEFFDLLDEAVFSTPFTTGEAPENSDPGGRVASDLPTRSPHPELDVGQTVGRYRIQSLIGRGGMGMVYRAHDERLKRDVALKFLPPLSSGRDDEERLLREAWAAAALEHPNVCSIHEIGETDDGRPFITMAFYEGETLKERLRHGPMPVEEAVATAVQIARGLAAAHARGIVHRDVKPGNVMLGVDGTVRILDFGIAQMTDATLIQSGGTPGTISYMSPEQARGGTVDPRTDLWSLGVVLHEMLTGMRPFRGGDDRTLLEAILHADPEPVSKRRTEVPAQLERVVQELLRKDPGARYQRAADVLSDLAEALSPDAVPPRPRVVTRRGVVLAGSATAVVAVAGIALWPPGRGGDSTPAMTAESQPFSQQTRNMAAYELYLRGYDSARLARVEEALGHFQQAVAADPTYAAAYAGLAVNHLRLGHTDLAEEAARKALALDGSLGEAHYALGRVHLAAFDFSSAETEIRRAIALGPAGPRYREWMARLQLVTLHLWAGRQTEALAEARRAMKTDPHSPVVHAEVAHALFATRHYDEALAQLDRLAVMQAPLEGTMGAGASGTTRSLTRGQCYAKKRMWPEAIAALRREAEGGDMLALSLLGHTLARAGQWSEARRILEDLLAREQRAEVGAFQVAVVYAGLRDFDQAFAWLDKSVDDKSLRVQIMEPTFDDLHRDPRFEQLRKRLGLQKL